MEDVGFEVWEECRVAMKGSSGGRVIFKEGNYGYKILMGIWSAWDSEIY